MAAITLGSPSFDPAVLGNPTTALPSATIEIVGGDTSTAMVGETDPIFSAWDKKTGITINTSQILADSADIVPLGLTCSSQGLTAGTQSAYVVLSWTAIVSSTFSHYKVRYKRNAFSAYSYIDVYTNTVSIEGLVSNTLYNFGVASVNKSDVVSAYSTNIDVTTTADTTAPAKVTGVTATASMGSIILKWTANTDADIASYNIYRKITNDSATSTKIANIAGTYFTDGELPLSQIQYYWLKAVDTSGNLSATYSDVVSATPNTTFDQTAFEALLGANLEDIAVINPVTGYINANTVGTLQIHDDAITAAKILDGELTAAKLNVTAISATGDLNVDTVGTAQIATGAVTHALLANDAIEANNIAVDAVTGPAIQASAITAGKIGAGEITANHILTGALDATHITSFNFILTEGSFTSNSPTDSISWTGCKVMYNGTEYTITNSTCDVSDKHIYWELGTPTVFLHSVALPTLTNNGFLVAFNDAGTYRLVWNSTVINGNRITTGSITATQIGANAIIAGKIDANAVTSSTIAAGAVTANKIKSYNFTLNSTTDGAVWTNNTGTGIVSWSGVTVTYDGVTYNINNGSSHAGDIFIYWENGSSDFSHSVGLPTLHNGDFIVGTSGSTSRNILPGTMIFNQSGTVIDGNTISTGSITAGQIAVGTITANLIGADEIRAEHIKAGEIEASHLSVTAGATFVHTDGGTYASAPAYPNLKIFPDANTGLQALDDTGSNVLKVEVGGTNVGDVTIGNYAGSQGILYDKSANTTYFKGNVTATSGLIGAWNIDSDSIYTGTKVTGDGYAASAGDMTIKSNGSIHAKNFYIDADGEVSFSAQSSTANINGLGFKIVNIGYWNMDSTASVNVDPTVVPANIRGIMVEILSDSNTTPAYKKYPIEYNADISGIPGGRWSIIDGSSIKLERWGGGFFDSADFDASNENRGYIIILYST